MLNSSTPPVCHAKGPDTTWKVTDIVTGSTGTHTSTGMEPDPVAAILPSNTTRPHAASPAKHRLEHCIGAHTACEPAGRTRPTLRLFKAGSGGARSAAPAPPRAEGPHPRDAHPSLRRAEASLASAGMTPALAHCSARATCAN